MYPVTQGFLDAMRAAERQVFAKVVVDYTNPFLDQSIAAAVSEEANVSYPEQTADAVEQVPHRWASLDGTWTLDGTCHLAPVAADLTLYQMGWWGLALAGTAGALSAPYPTLTVSFLPRPIHELKVVGDTARGEYPVDFAVRLYDQADALLHEEAVTGNGAVSWAVTLGSSVNGVAKMVLEITRWSHEGRQAKVTEFFTSIQQTYLPGDLLGVRLLEEREVSQGSLPVGNISANEVEIGLANEGRKFDANNAQSPLYQLLKPNRRVQVWLGAVAPNHASDKMPTFSRSSSAYTSDGSQVAPGVPRFEAGKFGQAVLIEEGTTTLLGTDTFLDTDDDVDGMANGWIGYQSGAAAGTRVMDAGTVTMGRPASQRIERTGGASGDRWGIRTEMVSGAAPPNTVSALVNVTALDPGASAWLYADYYDATQGFLGSRSQYLAATTSGWQRVTLSPYIDPAVANVRLYVWIEGGNGVLYVQAVQSENKVLATSFIDGVRAAESLSVPTAGVLSPTAGTVEAWVYYSSEWANGPTYRQIFEVYRSDGGQDAISLYYAKGSQGLFLKTWSGGVSPSYASKSMSGLSEGWHHVAATWDAAKSQVFIDGEPGTAVSNPDLPSALADSVYIGSDDGTDHHLDSLIDDLRISSKARSDAEIEAAYLADTPFAWDEHTTYLRFDGDLCPVEKTYVPLGTLWSLDWDAPDDALEARLTARDRLELLRKGTYQSSQVAQNVTLYDLAETVLQDGGLEAGEYWLDPALQDTVVPYAWFTPISHREALRRIAEAALAAVYSDRDGVIRLEVGGTGLGSTPALEIGAADYFPPLHTPSRQDQVANEVIVDTQPLQPAASAEEVYRSNSPVTVPAGGSVQVTVYYNQPPVIAVSAALDNPPPGVSITGATYYGWGAEVTIGNSGGSAAEVTLYITGELLRVANKERAVARDQASIEEHGVLRYEFAANPLVQTVEVAQAVADALLASVKDARRDVGVEWRGNPAVLLGDCVTVKDRHYYVIRQEIEWAGGLSARLTGRKAT